MDTVWIREPTCGFILGRITELLGDGAEVVPLDPRYPKVTCSFDDIFQAGDPNKEVDDNCEMMFLNEATLLNNIKRRYLKDHIYSYVANILIVVNPYKEIPNLYKPEMIQKYKGDDIEKLPPHVFAIANKAVRDVKILKQSQSIIVSGESGAGKTETTKHLLRFLCDSGSTGPIEQNILKANPVLEAFGNAKTKRNNNSSRFGKFMEVHYDEKFNVVGGHISHYLLEKSRICSASGYERTYHIFYILLGGAPREIREKLHLTKPDDFNYLKNGCTRYFASKVSETKLSASQKSAAHTKQGSLRDNVMDDVENFEILDKALKVIGLSDYEISEIYNTVAAVLHLGNINFEEIADDTRGSCTVTSSSAKSLTIACKMLGVDEDTLQQSLVYKSMQSNKGTQRGTLYMVPLKIHEAINARDALAKAIYSKLFDYIVYQINKSIPCSSSTYYVGLLDIAGFEFYTVNSFEQFCINYCNEKLQHFFNEKILKHEIDLYTKEGIVIPTIKFVDNQDCIDIIEMSKKGILSLLDEESKMPKPSYNHFTSEVFAHWVNNYRLDLPRSSKLQDHRKIRDNEGFLIKHFAGAVCYQTVDFIEKNNDALHFSLEEIVKKSKNRLIESFFENANSAQKGKLNFISVGKKFKTQLEELMEKLKYNGTNFIRCIKPNLQMEEKKFEGVVSLTQLKSSGVIHALELIKNGYPSRSSFLELHSMYSGYFSEGIKGLRPTVFCEALVYGANLQEDDYKFGISRVFFKLGKFSELDSLIKTDPRKLDEIVRGAKRWLGKSRWIQSQFGILAALKFKKDLVCRRNAATEIQRKVKGFLVRKRCIPRIRGLKRIKSLDYGVEQLEIFAKDIRKNKEGIIEDINKLKNEIAAAMLRIKRDIKITEKAIDDLYTQLASKVNKNISELKKKAKNDKTLEEQEILQRIEDEMEKETLHKKDDERRKQELKEIIKKKMEEGLRKKQELDKKKKLDELNRGKIRQLQVEIEMLAEEEQKLRELLEQERQDHELALRLAVETNGRVEDNQQIKIRLDAIRRIRATIQGSKYDLSKWKYFELRNILVSSSTDTELLEACKKEFHRRLKIYHEWRLKSRNTSIKDDEVERAPRSITNVTKKPLRVKRQESKIDDNTPKYFRIAFRKSGSKDPHQKGWWFAHFEGQYVVRQMHILPNKLPVLLVAGKDDLRMFELSLDESGLMKKRGAEITEESFNTEWQKNGGKPYVHLNDAEVTRF